ncbi:hypothetical protein [Lentzea sp.]|uniref:hypothetical protein n=1 Tax=Lentzea sp. TaxID=56099 RepID=UPI002BB479DF|nr:hypothetical protein [Lentzea sp.]HUQ57130.1 hypothetical protein [Lentzea sp.]
MRRRILDCSPVVSGRPGTSARRSRPSSGSPGTAVSPHLRVSRSTWFLPITEDLRVGGFYQVERNIDNFKAFIDAC